MPLGFPIVLGGAAGMFVSSGYWLLLARSSEFGKERSRRQSVLQQARSTQKQRIVAWQDAAGRSSQLQSETKARIDELSSLYRDLTPKFNADIAELEKSKKDAQRRDYLRNEFVADAAIKGIGSNVKNALLSEGIETALDVLTRNLDR